MVIREDGLVLTIGYLITEAEEVWLTSNDGRLVSAHALAYDQETRVRPGAGAWPAWAARTGFRRRGQSQDRRSRRACRRDRSVRPGEHRGQAGIRRILGVPAGRGDLHRARPSVMGRRRARRRGRQAFGHRLAAPANEPKRRDRRHQHGRADRPVAANSRRPADARPGQQAAATLARRVCRREQRRGRGHERGRRRPGRASGPASGRHHLGHPGRRRSTAWPISTARCGRAALPEQRCP